MILHLNDELLKCFDISRIGENKEHPSYFMNRDDQILRMGNFKERNSPYFMRSSFQNE